MATFPSAAAQIQQPPSAVDQAAKLLSLKSMLQQQQLQHAQLASTQLAQQGQTMQNQEAAIQLRSQQAFEHAFSQPVNWSDPNAIQQVMETAAQNGATPQAIMSVNNAILDQRNKLATLDQTQLKVHQQQNDELRGSLLSAIQSKDPVAKQTAWKQSVDQAVQNGWVQAGQVPEVYPGDATATILANHLALGSVLAKEATAQQQAQATTENAQTNASRLAAQLPGIEADNAIKQAQAAAVGKNGLAGITPALADAQYRAIIQQQFLHDAGAAAPLTQQQLAFKQAYEAQKELVPKFNFTLQSGQMSNYVTPRQAALHGPQFLQTVSPQDRATLQALATGRIQFPSSFALRTPYWERMTALLNQYDPTFSQQRAELRNEFLVKGKSASNIRALNVATAHLDTLAQAAQAMGNGSFTPGNAVYNAVRSAFGSATPVTFDALKNAVAGEMANALKGSATDTEISNVEQTIKRSSSPKQFQGVVSQLMHIMQQKLGVYVEQYQQQNPGDTLFSPVLPSTKTIFQKYGAGAPSPAAASSVVNSLVSKYGGGI